MAATAGYDATSLLERLGSSGEAQLFQLLHAHRIAPLHDAVKSDDVTRQRDAIDGSLYTAARGYSGPAPTLGDGILAIGAGGAFGEADARSVPRIDAIAQSASLLHAFGAGDVFFDVSGETCASAWADRWRRMLRDEDAGDAAPRLALGWTCTQDRSTQSVDIPILHATWDVPSVQAARARGKTPWVSGGVLPRTGTFLLDADAVSPRVNGWLQAMADIPRWIVPQVAAWTDERQQEQDAQGDFVDPFADAETRSRWAGPSASWSNGGGVLVYPGLQVGSAREHSAGIVGVLPSIRLKNWRRGIEDAGYLQLAREKNAARADAIAYALLPSVFGDAVSGPPAWAHRGRAFFEARRALLSVILGRPGVALSAPAVDTRPATGSSASGGGAEGLSESGDFGALMLVGVVFVAGAARARRCRTRAMGQRRSSSIARLRRSSPSRRRGSGTAV